MDVRSGYTFVLPGCLKAGSYFLAKGKANSLALQLGENRVYELLCHKKNYTDKGTCETETDSFSSIQGHLLRKQQKKM